MPQGMERGRVIQVELVYYEVVVMIAYGAWFSVLRRTCQNVIFRFADCGKSLYHGKDIAEDRYVAFRGFRFGRIDYDFGLAFSDSVAAKPHSL